MTLLTAGPSTRPLSRASRTPTTTPEIFKVSRHSIQTVYAFMQDNMRYLSRKFINKIDELAQTVTGQVQRVDIIKTKLDTFNDTMNRHRDIFIQQSRQLTQQGEDIRNRFRRLGAFINARNSPAPSNHRIHSIEQTIIELQIEHPIFPRQHYSLG